ncbi:uncharacterized protein SEPMUDRAFT_120968 [Sphaerulina musiva SO2202]|uniref:Uncharacterized protein n=1 Tax=Sphaerulina musiva (strain SO2202) TaxID=692275 RepID=M3AUC0_SPHMS|nr:uncharacterized protein SEPMUDRAFT_120968 [Sphaerulina musiva SO2202]EMF09084.1 hypothetical protein SEPMUDRAFT_120968 [Sphaerulina musiva SO2202]
MGASGSISNTVAKGLQSTVNSIPITIIDDAKKSPSSSEDGTPPLWAQANFGGEPSEGYPEACEFAAEGCGVFDEKMKKRKRGERERDVLVGAGAGAAVGDDEMMMVSEGGDSLYHPHYRRGIVGGLTTAGKLLRGFELLLLLVLVVRVYQKIQNRKQKQKKKREGLGWKMVDEAEKGEIVA